MCLQYMHPIENTTPEEELQKGHLYFLILLIALMKYIPFLYKSHPFGILTPPCLQHCFLLQVLK